MLNILQIIQKMRRLLTRRDKLFLCGIALLLTFTAFLEMSGIGILIAVVTMFIAPEASMWKTYPRVMEIFNSCGIVPILCFLGMFFVAKSILALVNIKISGAFVYSKQRDLTVRLYNNYLKSDYAALTKKDISELDTNIGYCAMISSCVLMPMAQLASDFLLVILLGTALAITMPAITFSGLFFMILTGEITQRILVAKNSFYGEKNMQANIENAASRFAGLRNVAYVKNVGAEEFFTDKFRKCSTKSSKYDSMLFLLGQVPCIVLECAAMLLMLGVFVVLLVCGVPKGEILASFTAIVAVMARMLPALSRCHYNIARIIQNKFMFDSIFDDVADDPVPEQMGSGKDVELDHALVLENVSYIHEGSSVATPDNISLTIPACSSCGIAGRTGCGKTTLIELLLGLRHPTSGRITSDGVNIYDGLVSWRKKIGYVPQSVVLTAGTLRENIAFGVPVEEIDDKKVVKCLELAQLTEFPLDREITEDGRNLSGGQRQRIGIARALYRDIKLLILDEATSNLDSGTEDAFVAALESLRGKLTILVIAHREKTLEKCDKVINIAEKGLC